MALATLDLNPSKKKLQDFGLTALCMCAVIGLLLLWMEKIPLKGTAIFSAVGLVMYALSRISTALIKPAYQILVLVTFPIGWVVSHLVMALFYYVIITGVGLIFKILGRDPLCRKYDPQAETYWIPYKHKRSPEHYFRQF